jgi:hypothetical protein
MAVTGAIPGAETGGTDIGDQGSRDTGHHVYWHERDAWWPGWSSSKIILLGWTMAHNR